MLSEGKNRTKFFPVSTSKAVTALPSELIKIGLFLKTLFSFSHRALLSIKYEYRLLSQLKDWLSMNLFVIFLKIFSGSRFVTIRLEGTPLRSSPPSMYINRSQFD